MRWLSRLKSEKCPVEVLPKLTEPLLAVLSVPDAGTFWNHAAPIERAVVKFRLPGTPTNTWCSAIGACTRAELVADVMLRWPHAEVLTPNDSEESR